jgi:hypothetical protein
MDNWYRLFESRENHCVLEEMQMQLRVELFRRHNKIWRLIKIESLVIHTYLSCNIIAIQKKLTGSALLTKCQEGIPL